MINLDIYNCTSFSVPESIPWPIHLTPCQVPLLELRPSNIPVIHHLKGNPLRVAKYNRSPQSSKSPSSTPVKRSTSIQPPSSTPVKRSTSIDPSSTPVKRSTSIRRPAHIVMREPLRFTFFSSSTYSVPSRRVERQSGAETHRKLLPALGETRRRRCKSTKNTGN